MMGSQKSFEDIINNESYYYIKEWYPFFQHTEFSRKELQDFVTTFFFKALVKLMIENRIVEIKGKVLSDG